MRLPGKRLFFGDYIFDVCQNVYEPAEDSFICAENLKVDQGDRVLDLGTGCGILGILAATRAAEVVATDINPYAIKCAKENAKLNNTVDKMSFLQGDMFNPLSAKMKYDLILFNAPYLPAEYVDRDSWIERAWVGGASGRQIIEDFIHKSPAYLQRKGRLLLLQSTLSNLNETLRAFEEEGLKANVIAQRNLPFFESILLIEAEF